MGLGDTFGSDNQPWAMISTGGGRCRARPLLRTHICPAAAGRWPTPRSRWRSTPRSPHLYRIEWTATDVKFYVDGTLIMTPAAAIAGPMRPVVSDLNRLGDGGPTVKVDWLSMGAGPTSGTFTSRVLSADSAHTVWGNLTSVSNGTAFETRTGNTATPDASWSGLPGRQRRRGDPEPERAVHPVPRDAGRLVRQPRQRLARLHGRQRGAERGDRVGRRERHERERLVLEPRQRHQGLRVQHRRRSLRGLREPQGVHRPRGRRAHGGRAADRQGGQRRCNSLARRSASPARNPGGGGQTGGGGGAVDKTAPKVTLVAKSLKASKKGTVSFTVGCPATEESCKVTLKLKNGAKTVASQTVNVKGGKTKTVTLKLNKATAAAQAPQPEALRGASRRPTPRATSGRRARRSRCTRPDLSHTPGSGRGGNAAAPPGTLIERRGPIGRGAGAFATGDLRWCRDRRPVGMGRQVQHYGRGSIMRHRGVGGSASTQRSAG